MCNFIPNTGYVLIKQAKNSHSDGLVFTTTTKKSNGVILKVGAIPASESYLELTAGKIAYWDKHNVVLLQTNEDHDLIALRQSDIVAVTEKVEEK